MNHEQFRKVKNEPGFFAALDQSGGSTPNALRLYGIPPEAYSGNEQMFRLVHELRVRMMTSPGFGGDRILGAILFERTMNSEVSGRGAADYLWSVKGVVPFLKVDKGLEGEADGVQIMKPIPDLDSLLSRAVDKGMLGTKMRSYIKRADGGGIKAIVDQQFELARQILGWGLVPILEPEVDINSTEKAGAEEVLRDLLLERLAALPQDGVVMLKLTLPSVDDFYSELVVHPNVVRVLALSGGYTRDQAVARLARNHGVIASFSRALMAGLRADQSDEDFDLTLERSIEEIFEASRT
jgi:fructose-bisphosphate aldolase, class I